MKRIYLIRHGTTEANESYTHQHFDSPLSPRGREQAAFLAERLSKIPFDVLIASTMDRAQETARIIGQKTGHRVISEGLFYEWLTPSVIRGKGHSDPEVLEVMHTIRSYWKTDERHSDEENFSEFKQRALKGLEYLISRPEETMVVVTHGTIIRMMLALMMRGENLDSDFYEEVYEFLFPQNTGITWVEYDNTYHPNRWQLITWNDQAHLG